MLDRSELILDIFATRARTAEARLQVELAQLEYALPRLRQMWSHLGRAAGGIGTRGPGETQLEEDRRLVESAHPRSEDIGFIEVQARKEREVPSRREEHTVSLVGYTNAGKSTLMNALTGAGVYVEDKLFSTLDTRTRQWHVKDWGRVLLSDTVGFIRDLPHHLIASFKATLEEARQARLLLHVVDASNPHAEEQIKAVDQGAQGTRLRRQADAAGAEQGGSRRRPVVLAGAAERTIRGPWPSAPPSGQGLDDLQDAVIEMLGADFADAAVETDAGNGKVLAYLAAHAEIYRQEFDGRPRPHPLLPAAPSAAPHPGAGRAGALLERNGAADGVKPAPSASEGS